MARLEHIGIAVEDAAAAARLYDALLGIAPYKQETVAREGVRTHFLATGTAKLELLEALGPDTPVARHLARRGPGLHHLAFEVPDADAAMARLRTLGFTPLSDTPRPGADAKRIFFLHPRETGGVLVEFCQSVPTPLPEVPGVPGVRACGRAGAPPVLVLPAPGHDAEALMRRLEPHCFAFTPDADLPDASSLLDALGLERVHVVAEGDAARTAFGLARTLPRRVLRLVLKTPVLSPADLPDAAPPHPTLLVFDDAPGDLTALRARLPHASLALLPADDLAALFPVLLLRHLGL